MKTGEKELNFALKFAAGIDAINQHEGDRDAVQATVAELLDSLGFPRPVRYAVVVQLETELESQGGVASVFRASNQAVGLAVLVETAVRLIEDRRIPQELIDRVEAII